MMKLLLILFLVLAGFQGFAQERMDYPFYPVPAGYQLKSAKALPYQMDNSLNKHFPAVFDQYGFSCNQASSIGYVFTYELNRLRDVASDSPENLYSPGFTWNFCNSASWGVGVSYFDSYEIVKTAGSPNYIDYPYYHQGSGIWMSGYDRYYRAMQNRILVNYSIPVGTPEGLQILKQYLFDHFEGTEAGGVASFQISSDRMDTRTWKDPVTEESWPVIYTFGVYVGHAMTFVGYNDSVRVDLNNDGRYTNDLDITNDGMVDMRDWEIGALMAVNSWGQGWGKGGKSYVLYGVIAREGNQGGIWNRSVHVVKAIKEYYPQLTMRVVMRHESREKIRVLAGISTDTAATRPQQILPFPLFSFQGDDSPLQDPENDSDPGRFEFGLDISPLLTNIEPGTPVKFFLTIEEKDPFNSASGQVDEFSVIHYGDETSEVVADQRNSPIINNAFTYLGLVRHVDFEKITVDPPAGTDVTAGQPFSVQLSAQGGKPPYRWELVRDYDQKAFARQYPQLSGDTLAGWNNKARFHRIDLPFEFDFYGEKYRSLIADINGALHFDNEYFQYPYAVDEDLAFRVRKSIAPFGADIQINMESDRLISKVTDSVAIFQWQASVSVEPRLYTVNVTAYLYPDGSIEFLYGKRSRPPQADYDWVSGISSGDGRSYKYSLINETRLVFENYGIRFTPMDYPDNLQLTDDGLLTGMAQEDDRIWNIFVKVTDVMSQSQLAAIPVTTVDWENARSLGQNYPNPFSQTTSIAIRVPEESMVSLEIFDFAGRKIKQVANGKLQAGEFTFYWNARDEKNRDVNPGLYIYRLRIGERTESGKMVLIR